MSVILPSKIPLWHLITFLCYVEEPQVTLGFIVNAVKGPKQVSVLLPRHWVHRRGRVHSALPHDGEW